MASNTQKPMTQKEFTPLVNSCLAHPAVAMAKIDTLFHLTEAQLPDTVLIDIGSTAGDLNASAAMTTKGVVVTLKDEKRTATCSDLGGSINVEVDAGWVVIPFILTTTGVIVQNCEFSWSPGDTVIIARTGGASYSLPTKIDGWDFDKLVTRQINREKHAGEDLAVFGRALLKQFPKDVQHSVQRSCHTFSLLAGETERTRAMLLALANKVVTPESGAITVGTR